MGAGAELRSLRTLVGDGLGTVPDLGSQHTGSHLAAAPGPSRHLTDPPEGALLLGWAGSPPQVLPAPSLLRRPLNSSAGAGVLLETNKQVTASGQRLGPLVVTWRPQLRVSQRRTGLPEDLLTRPHPADRVIPQ